MSSIHKYTQFLHFKILQTFTSYTKINMKIAFDRKKADCWIIFFLELLVVKVKENVKTLKTEYFCLKFDD